MPRHDFAPAVIRRATPRDVGAVLSLCAEHAAYERAPLDDRDRADALRRALFLERPRLWCLVVEAAGALSGYATYALEFSTWQAEQYVHVDCLYLQPRFRGGGIGGDIMNRIAAHAALLGCAEIQWQTPAWNEGAIRFYDRLGATRVEKLRYRWTPTRSPEFSETP